MSAIIFAGPTLAEPDILRLCDATVLPPAAMGDVFHAARRHPRAIGIIDGYFEGAPSVWHKEILWAMAEGIAVFGAASMGALRAAELASFGMRGVGDIYEGYLAGRLEDDDEVAVEHGPAGMGYITMSEPMVNIRATLARAVSEGIVSVARAQGLIGLAKERFYKERSWHGLLRDGARDMTSSERDALARWLPANTIDVKKNDALKMVAAMAQFLAAPQETTKDAFALEWTVMWDKAMRSFIPFGAVASSDAEAVLDELRLQPEHYAGIRRRALARKLLDTGAPPDHAPADKAALRREMTRFRARKGLLTHSSLLHWLNENGLDAATFEKLLEDELRLVGAASGGLDRYVIAELQLDGAYSALARRARQKQELLDGDIRGRRQARHRLNVLEARLRYFEEVLGRPVPDDIAQYAEESGFAGIDAMDRAIMREVAFRRRMGDAASE